MTEPVRQLPSPRSLLSSQALKCKCYRNRMYSVTRAQKAVWSSRTLDHSMSLRQLGHPEFEYHRTICEPMFRLLYQSDVLFLPPDQRLWREQKEGNCESLGVAQQFHSSRGGYRPGLGPQPRTQTRKT